MPAHVKEAQFQEDILNSLASDGGYDVGDAENFDRVLGIDTNELLQFITTTQPREWTELVKRHGGNETTAFAKFSARLAQQLSSFGTVNVLRDGVEDQRVKIRLVYFKSPTTMNPDLLAKYAANRLTVVKELRYATGNDNRLDLTLFVNGIPVATAELKNPLNGQGVNDAIEQYKTDRDPADVTLSKRAVVHFAVDPSLAYMTTKLDGNDTFFLPFNKGNDDGAGNPSAPPGKYKTHYLWETVWAREPWLDVLGRFIQQTYDAKTKKPRTPLFPRYHQWDAVLAMEAHAKNQGSGHMYLAQHSAGSGKSNTIAWLGHRLSVLRNGNDHKIFDKVIVITDRRVLDVQLRANVESMEKVKGTVVAVTESGGSKSSNLAEALRSNAKIVITTLQTFPYVLSLVDEDELASKTYAVLIDEAHSSQSGDAANALRRVLGEKVTKAIEEAGDDLTDAEVGIAAVLAARERQENMSFFAFTATPKARTVNLFGTAGTDGKMGPFHLYSMRQAIEEGFILNVLDNYITYDTYYRLVAADQELAGRTVEVSEASRELRKAVVSHPQLIAEKARIIVEHVRKHTLLKIGGKAKAMVVTDSIKSAIRYKLAIDSYLVAQGYDDIKALVAFSGKKDLDGQDYTESRMNRFPDSETGARFKGEVPHKPGAYQVLVVAEKFQTGFDEPLLHTMFVDKTLSDVAAVQTLSRLNRIYNGKTDTMVIDFRNKRDAIQAEFQKFYKETTVAVADPNALSDARDAVLRDYNVISEEDVVAATDSYFAMNAANRIQALIYGALDPALERYEALDEEDQAAFKKATDRFIRIYSFLSQVFPDNDPNTERLFAYCRALLQVLPDGQSGRLQLGDKVVLTHLALEADAQSAIDLVDTESDPLLALPGSGLGGAAEKATDILASIIDRINNEHGLNLDDTHKLALEQIFHSWLRDDDLKPVAEANSYEDFLLEFQKKFVTTVLGIEESNKALFDVLVTDVSIREQVLAHYAPQVFHSLRST